MEDDFNISDEDEPPSLNSIKTQPTITSCGIEHTHWRQSWLRLWILQSLAWIWNVSSFILQTWTFKRDRQLTSQTPHVVENGQFASQTSHALENAQLTSQTSHDLENGQFASQTSHVVENAQLASQAHQVLENGQFTSKTHDVDGNDDENQAEIPKQEAHVPVLRGATISHLEDFPKLTVVVAVPEFPDLLHSMKMYLDQEVADKYSELLDFKMGSFPVLLRYYNGKYQLNHFEVDQKPELDRPSYVFAPNSPNNTIIQVQGNQRIKTQKWTRIQQSLENIIGKLENYCTEQIEIGENIIDCIKSYNPSQQAAKFELLKQLPNSPKIASICLSIAKQALNYPKLFQTAIPLLRQNENQTLFLTGQQIHCILSNGFFCTFPNRTNARNSKNSSEFSNYGDINFFNLYQNTNPRTFGGKIQKLTCLLNYFYRRMEHENEKDREQHRVLISFERKALNRSKYPDFSTSTKRLTKLCICPSGKIEDACGTLQVDFANKFVGGGILGNGAVMEEIRFSICPELIAARLFTECLADNETLVTTGAQRYSKYAGYGHTFKYSGNYDDADLLQDTIGRKTVQLVAMDASLFSVSDRSRQFSQQSINRELIKCYCGFFDDKVTKYLCSEDGDGSSLTSEELPAIASGNWGCGVYNGYPYLKYFIQWMAAAESGRDLYLFTIGKEEAEFQQVANILLEKQTDVASLYNCILSYGAESDRAKLNLLAYIKLQL